jgi:hypothetical protein
MEKLTDDPSEKKGMARGSTSALETSHRYDAGAEVLPGEK